MNRGGGATRPHMTQGIDMIFRSKWRGLKVWHDGRMLIFMDFTYRTDKPDEIERLKKTRGVWALNASKPQEDETIIELPPKRKPGRPKKSEKTEVGDDGI